MKKILLIEDNSDVRENTSEILSLANYDVVVAENGKIGVDLAQRINPDLIICDIMMPALDGYGVLHILSKNESTAGIPFIFLTAKTEKSDIRKGMNLGADDYLTKPFDDTDLLNAIEARLRKTAMQQQQYDPTPEGLDNFIKDAQSVLNIKDLGKEKTVIFSTHIMQEVQALCDRVMIINNGKIVANDTIDMLQNRITGENVVTIELSQSIDLSLLNKIKGVKSIKNLGENRYQLLSNLTTDVRSDVFHFAVERNLTLLEMKKEVFSVEDVFQELTK